MQITFYFFNFIKYLNRRPLNFKLYVQVTAPWALIRERCLSKKILLLGRRFFEMGTYLRMGAKKSAHKSNLKLPFPAVKLGFHLLLLMITEHYSYSAQPAMKSHFSRYSSHVTKSRIFKILNLRKKVDRNFNGTFLKNHFRHLKLYSNLRS